MTAAAPPRILQFGTIGQLGIEMIRSAQRAAVPLSAVSLDQADFTRPDDVRHAVEQAGDVDVAVNCAAYTAVDKAESEEALARTINADTVGVLAEACAKRALPLVHVSTDFVFDGQKSAPYIETDAANPLNAYGRTKLAGERAVQAAGNRHVIIRTSWVYSAHGSNFVKTMLRLGAERETLSVVDDQHGAPTSAADLAAAILTIARGIHAGPAKDQFGIFHYAGAGETTWRRFAEAILEEARSWAQLKAKIIPILAADYPSAAQRPANSRMNCEKISRVYGVTPVPWRTALRCVMNELRSQSEMEKS